MPETVKLTVKDICRAACDLSRSHREIGRLLEVSPTTIAKYRNLMKIHQIDRARLKTLSDAEIETLVQAKYYGGKREFTEPDWETLCQELSRKDVTIALLYQEYVDDLTKGADKCQPLSLSSFTRRLRKALKSVKTTMRQTHAPGEKLFVDFSGKHLYLTDPRTRKATPVEVFVAALGASQLLFATAVASQKLPDWIEANVRALEYYGGVPARIVPDNLKSAVTRPKRGKSAAQINRTYLDFAEHYDVTIDPARSLHPQDKALAEIGVRLVNMWVIAALRNHVFHSLADMNAEISQIVERLNRRVSRRLGASRQELFEKLESVTLAPLPPSRYETVEWRDNLLVPKDYHLRWAGDYYSVPHSFVGRRVNIAVTRSVLKAYSREDVSSIAVHQLGPGTGIDITDPNHMSPQHRAYASENREDMLRWGHGIAPEVGRLFDAMMENSRISAQSALRQMSQARRLAKEYGVRRFVAACLYANCVGTQTVESVKSILRHNADLRNQSTTSPIVASPVPHENVRGASSYDGSK